MNGIRRGLVLLGTLAGLMVTTSLPASASFSAHTAPVSTTINTMVVAAPTNVVGNLACAATSTMSWDCTAVVAMSTDWTWTGIPAAVLAAMPIMARVNDPSPRRPSWVREPGPSRLTRMASTQPAS